MNKQPEITDKTREKFIEVFCHLYSQDPIEKITIQKITKLAGYNRSTFYHYFSDIYELLEYVENDLLSYIIDSSEKSKIKTPEYILRLFEDKELYVKALLGKYGSIRFLERIKESFPVNQDLESITSNSSLTPYLIEFHISTSLSLFHLWLNRDKDLPAEKLFTLIHNLYIDGMKTYLE